jgi:hypothetical protein
MKAHAMKTPALKTYEIANQLITLDKKDPDYRKKRMALMVKYLQRYMETYPKQYGYENYNDFTFIDDLLYGLGVALNPKEHQFATGYDVWKQKLIEFLNGNKYVTDPVTPE